ncbi:PQQ-binding-like beta-propeller repeat protein [Altererythrobacter sp. MF3-039]|uniref:outer membrane protein assembly factor BamB family protein n=1 Tax=Altererythrobacter sp. MF3-039 TaxID=3252901 RepID=UPI00390C8F59
MSLPTFLVFLAALSACGQEPNPDAPHTEEVAALGENPAEALYQEHCAACHDSGQTEAPTKAAIRNATMQSLVETMTTGVMQQQAANMSPAEIRILADYLAIPSGVDAQANAEAHMCEDPLKLSKPLWNRWGNNRKNQRFQTLANAGLGIVDVPDLELKWAFGFPGSARARSQPAVTEDAIYIGSQSGLFYALNLESGCVHWTFQADAEVRHAPTIATGDDGRAKTLFFGDFDANLYAVSARTGKLIWKRTLKDHAAGTMTGSPTLHDGRLYVPMSSTEVINAYLPDYECCTFRGGVLAVEAKSGNTIWRYYTVEQPQPTGENSVGARRFGPSGAPVWNSPTVDDERGLIYFGTGENYSSPANDKSDAIIALDLNTGQEKWVTQTIAGDAWNGACGRFSTQVNCPEEDGPDFDFGAPPILLKLAGGKDILLAGQKSGMIYGLDPDDGGAILWERRAGMGGFNGGVHWGMATDGTALYVGIADTPGNKFATGPSRQGLHAYDPATGEPLWSRYEPNVCEENEHRCRTALSAPPTVIPGVIFAGALNGILRAYSSRDGSILWSRDTRREFETINGVEARGGSIDSAGPVVVAGHLIVNSGYDKFAQIPGNVLLVYAPARRE